MPKPGPTATTRPRNTRGQGPRLREEIVTAAMAVVDESPEPSALTLRGVARQAGISAPSIYAHFADVQAVADAVLERSFAELDAAVAAAMEAAAAPAEALVAGCRAYVEFAWQHRERYRFMVAGGGFAPDAIRTFDRIRTALQACVDSGTSTSADPHADAFLVWVGMHGMATLEKPRRADLRQLGPLDRVALTESLARRLAGLQ